MRADGMTFRLRCTSGPAGTEDLDAQPEKINCNNYSNCNKTIILLQ